MRQTMPKLEAPIEAMATAGATETPSRARLPAKPVDEDVSGAVAGLLRAIDRLEETIVQETNALRERAIVDLKGFNNRKNQGLLELSRSIRHLEGGKLGEQAAARVFALRQHLEANLLVIKMHVEAVREVSTIVSDAIREADSDGTYSASIGRGVQRP